MFTAVPERGSTRDTTACGQARVRYLITYSAICEVQSRVADHAVQRRTARTHTWGRAAMSETVDEARDSALERAAQATATDPGGGGASVGDLTAFLRVYYRHVATEDLVAFGSEQLAAVAAAHADLAAERPQGRALVQVADASPVGQPSATQEAEAGP